MDFIKKIQSRPEKERKIFFWIMLVFSVAIVGFFWIKSLGNSFEKFKIEAGKIDSSSKEVVDQTKKDLPVSQINEAINKFKEFLKDKKTQEFLQEKTQK